MSDRHRRGERSKQRSSINRRRTLGALGTSAGAILGSGFVRTVSGDPSDVRDTDAVKALLRAVGNPEITSREAKVYEGEEYTTKIAVLETEIGTLSVHEALSSDVEKIDRGDTAATFKIEALSRATRGALPDRFDEVPVGVDLSLKYESGEMLLATSVTKAERQRLAELVGAEELVALHIGEESGFYYVNVLDGGEYRVSGRIDRPRMENTSVESLVDARIDEDACFDCGTEAPFCVPYCAFDCNPWSGDILSCGACIADNCVDMDVVSCAKCIASLPEELR
jgi:hypothetical protein